MSRYVIIASNVNRSSDIFPATNLVTFTEKLEFDLAVVDIRDFCAVFCSELTTDELIRVFNQTYAYLQDPSLCGRNEFIESYRSITGAWVDEFA